MTLPQDGSGKLTPAPMKDSEASKTMASATWTVQNTSTGAAQLTATWRSTMCGVRAPITASPSLVLAVLVEDVRADDSGHRRGEQERDRADQHRDAAADRDQDGGQRDAGNAITTSRQRINVSSTAPREVAAIAPRSAPTTRASAVAPRPIARDQRAPYRQPGLPGCPGRGPSCPSR